MKRLGYKKSRSGCTRCKERRIKCDEKRPCTACIKHSIPCSLVVSITGEESVSTTLAGRTEPSDRSPMYDRLPHISTALEQSAGTPVVLNLGQVSNLHNQDQDISTFQTDPFVYFARFLTEHPMQCSSDWIATAGLMHHYSTVAFSTLSANTEVHKALQFDVPREGLRHPFLMHQILAFSSLHLAFQQNDHRQLYLMQASQHQSHAITGLRDALVGTISPNNCHAIYATSTFIVLGAFAILPCYEQRSCFVSTIDSVLEIFTLIKGMGVIVSSTVEDLRRGPLRGLLHKPKGKEGRAPLKDLLSQTSALKSYLAYTDTLDHEARTCMDAATSALCECLTEGPSTDDTLDIEKLRAVIRWPLFLPEEFIEYVRRRHPAAVTILLHYSVILHCAEANFWFLKGWSASLVKACNDVLAGTPWEAIAQWPINAIT
ncbi:hypothetical protein BKA67DRAFT_620318 [Truncatella angustata]|uniref:Zn(2)-C6 fungal-type domain-containing protein n=1 Tax=Truncatella angustata TaxID=152316 RepID=A0A9P9A2N8_9PEZI|nr:uncharacterized protein BKA67DRAFT_620318 [Truncatella angustata]KAH6658145.1 hypothetical protein BKA67DRAFT_620318 [Truncatella angustata]